MAKIYGLFGTMRGKVADVVMAVRNGEQIVRKYQPIVSNPRSPAQVAARAKLKLLSQLSANYAPIIAIRRHGNITTRNLFQKRNYEFVGYVGGQAEVTLADVQLTNSAVSMAGFSVSREDGKLSLALSSDMGTSVDRVVYVVVKKTSNQELIIANSKIVEFEEGAGTFPTTMPDVTGEIVIMAYGIRLNNAAARIAFGNLTAPTAQEVAKLMVRMANFETALTLTETRGLQMAADATTAETTGVLRVTITPEVSSAGTSQGTVSGGGRVAEGEKVTLNAVPSEGNRFVGWYSRDGRTSSQFLVSTDASYSFIAGSVSQTLYALFYSIGS